MTAPALVLDSQALSAFAQPSRSAAIALAAARRNDQTLVVPAVVLAEVLTGKPADAPCLRLLKGAVVAPTTEAIGARAGALRDRAASARKKKRDLTIDAIVAATAESQAPAVVLTSDPDDLTLLLSPTDVRVTRI